MKMPFISERKFTTNFNQLKKSDLISRQAAIDLLDALFENAFDYLCELPTAEPELANNSPKVENGNGDLISRQAAIEIIQSMYPEMPRIPWMLKDWQKRYEPYIRTENAIRKLPTAEKRGEWISHEGYEECSQCGRFSAFCSKFCPNCGARMEESE